MNVTNSSYKNKGITLAFSCSLNKETNNNNKKTISLILVIEREYIYL
jgi:hypothetical protein